MSISRDQFSCWMILAKGLSGGCNLDVGQSCSHLKAWYGFWQETSDLHHMKHSIVLLTT